MDQGRPDPVSAAAVLAAAWLSVPQLALLLSVVAMAVCVYNLSRLNKLAEEVCQKAERQGEEISGLGKSMEPGETRGA